MADPLRNRIKARQKIKVMKIQIRGMKEITKFKIGGMKEITIRMVDKVVTGMRF